MMSRRRGLSFEEEIRVFLKIPTSLERALCIIREQSIKCGRRRVKRTTEAQLVGGWRPDGFSIYYR